MKLSAFVLASVTASVFGTNLNLRSGVSKNSEPSKYSDARIVVHGLVEEISETDADIIGKTFISALDEANSMSGVTVQKFSIQSTGTIPDIDADLVVQQGGHGCNFCPPDDDLANTLSTIIVANVGQGGGHGCNFCPPDDDFSAGLTEEELGFKHSAVEIAFCEKLRHSGSANLVNAKGCSISFLESSGKASFAHNEVQVMLQGTLQDLSSEDVAIFDKSVTAAFNEAFKKADYSLAGIQAIADIDITPVTQGHGCNLCPPDDDIAAASTLVLASVKQGGGHGCNFCPPDDDETTTLKDSDIALMESAFEKALCHKLANSGSANFANLSNCSFRFVANPAQRINLSMN